MKLQHALPGALPGVCAVLGHHAPFSVDAQRIEYVLHAGTRMCSLYIFALPCVALPCTALHGPANRCTVLQEGWLSASGRLMPAGSDAVEVAFDRFWVDFGSTALRPSLGNPALWVRW